MSVSELVSFSAENEIYSFGRSLFLVVFLHLYHTSNSAISEAFPFELLTLSTLADSC